MLEDCGACVGSTACTEPCRAKTLVRDVSALPCLLTVRDAAALLRTTSQTVYKRIERGQLAGVTRIGRRILIYRDYLVRYLDEGRAPSPEVRH